MNRIAFWGAVAAWLVRASALSAQELTLPPSGPWSSLISEPWTRDGAFWPPQEFGAAVSVVPPEILVDGGPQIPAATTTLPFTGNDAEFPVVASSSFDGAEGNGITVPSWPQEETRELTLFSSVLNDQRNYYRWTSLRYLVVPIAAGAVLANTSFDRHFQQDVKFSDAFHDCKTLGNGAVVLPALAGIALAGRLFEKDTLPGGIGHWGERSLRAAATGAPTLLLLQYTLGGSRPGESPLGSHWHPFADNNGVSGHAYIGAVPMLTAARLTDRPLLKAGLIGGSMLAGASRITDENHYLSQVIIGWSIAWVAVAAVNQTETGETPRFIPWVGANSVGMGFTWQH